MDAGDLLERVNAAKVYPTRSSLLRMAAQTAPAGIACEFGVHTGASLRWLRNFRKPPVFGFDSFEGLPKEWATGGPVHYPAGHFACSMPRELPIGTYLVPGWFSETIPAWKKENAGPVALLHIDCDLYESAREVLGGLNDRIAAGSVLIFDELVDFACESYPKWRDGEWRALVEWIAECGREVDPIGRTTHQQVAFVVRI